MISALPTSHTRTLRIAHPSKNQIIDKNISLLSLRTSLQEAQQLHALLIKTSQISYSYYASRLAEFYAVSENGSLECAHMVVNSIDEPNIFAWNTLIRGNLKAQNARETIKIYGQMLHRLAEPDYYTFTFILKACTQLQDLEISRQFHSQIIKHGFEYTTFIRNKMIHVYAVSGSLVDSRKVFDKSPELDIVTWNTMLEGYAENGDSDALHQLFDKMPIRDVVSWNTMISHYVQVGDFKSAVPIFRRMKEEGESIDSVTLISVLAAVSHLGALGLGHWVDASIDKLKIDLDENLGSALINMYAKCGCVEGAIGAFYRTKRKGVDTWNALISGLAVNGQSATAIEFFSKMESSNVKPNAITFSSVLNACSHGGLVKDGLRLFDKMRTYYGIDPDIVHYGCLVDLLSRAALFDKVEEILESMPMQPDAVMLKALLSACRVHKNFNLGKKAGQWLMELAPDDDAGYVLLSNIFALEGNLASVLEMRKEMRKKGIRKQAGCSSIEVNDSIHEFVVGDITHPRKDEIYQMLDEMVQRLKMSGYEPDVDQVLLDIDEQDMKHTSLFHHSEKLAVAFGLISTSPGTTIRVVKNLRMCSDCHSAFKLLSSIYNRIIIVRDSSRFHHFNAGSCSCMDYW